MDTGPSVTIDQLLDDPSAFALDTSDGADIKPRNTNINLDALRDLVDVASILPSIISATAPQLSLRDEDDYGDCQVLGPKQTEERRALNEEELIAEVEALKQLHQLGEQSLGKRVANATNRVTKKLEALGDEGFNKETRLKTMKEELRVSFSQIPDIADLTADENEKLSIYLLQIFERSSSQRLEALSRSAENRSKDFSDILYFIMSNFQKGVAEIEKLIERAKNKEFLGEKHDEEREAMMDLLRQKKYESKKSVKVLPKANFNRNAAPDFSQLAAQQFNGAKKVTRGRKSIRQITEDLETKIELYKTNQVEMEMFLKRIEKYEEEARLNASTDIIKNNKLQVINYVPNKREKVLRKEFQHQEERRLAVLEAKRRKDQEDQQRRIDNIERKEEQAGALINARKDRELRERMLMQQQRWFMLIVLGSRIQVIQDFLEHHNKIRMSMINQVRSALVIQSVWRKHFLRKNKEQRLAATVIIGRAVLKYLPTHRERMKHKAANMIRNFFLESDGVSKLMKVIKKYRYDVVTCQRAVRHHLQIRRDRVKMLTILWDKVEPVWWKQRTADAGGNEDAPKKASKARKNKQKDDDGFHVPDNIKLQVITDDLLRRQKEYRAVNWDYRKKLADWMIKYKKKLDMMKNILGAAKKPEEVSKTDVLLPRNQLTDIVVDGLEINPKTGYPAIMIFQAMMTNQEMIQLIERGFVLASEMK